MFAKLPTTLLVVVICFELAGTQPTIKLTRGTDARKGRFPYMCSIRRKDNRQHSCGGTIIDAQWVITAAHCIDAKGAAGEGSVVYCGIHRVDEEDESKTFVVTEEHFPPEWNGDAFAGGDIALLKLNRPANGVTKPRLSTGRGSLNTRTLLTAIGWGKTETGALPSVLQMTEGLQFITHENCQRIWEADPRRDLTGREIFDNLMICAGAGGVDVCTGDSGGPLLRADKAKIDINTGLPAADLVIGIVSFGADCEQQNLFRPSVYTRVSYYSSWIQSVISGQVQNPPASRPARPSPASPSPARPAPRPPTIPRRPPTTDTTPGQARAAFDAINADDSEALKILLDEGVDPNAVHNNEGSDGSSDYRLLHWAARFDAVDSIRLLVDEGADILGVNIFGHTPLHTSGQFNTENAARVLIELGAETNKKARDGRTALHMASWSNHGNQINVIAVLVENGADIEASNGQQERPLHDCSWAGHSDVAQFLLDEGAEVDPVNQDGKTPMHRGSENGHVQIIRVLLDYGASKEAKDSNDETPLDVVCELVRCQSTQRQQLVLLLTP